MRADDLSQFAKRAFCTCKGPDPEHVQGNLSKRIISQSVTLSATLAGSCIYLMKYSESHRFKESKKKFLHKCFCRV